jgi:hypothetical protein
MDKTAPDYRKSLHTMLYKYLFLFAVAFTVQSCMLEEPYPFTPPVSDEPVREKVFGYTLNDALIKAAGFASIRGDTVSITGVMDNGDRLVLVVLKNAPGTYPLDAVSGNFAIFVETVNGAMHSFLTGAGAAGTLTIESVDTTKKVISGTFNVEVKNEAGTVKKIKEGNFSAAYNHNTMTAAQDMNGDPWVAASTVAVAKNDTVSITAVQFNGSSVIKLRIPLPGLKSGFFDFKNTDAIYSDITGGASYYSETGKIRFKPQQEGSRKMDGVFEFSGTDPVTFTPFDVLNATLESTY